MFWFCVVVIRPKSILTTTRLLTTSATKSSSNYMYVLCMYEKKNKIYLHLPTYTLETVVGLHKI